MQMRWKAVPIVIMAVFISTVSYAQIVNIENKRIATDTTGLAGKVGLSLSAAQFRESFVAADVHAQLQYKRPNDLYLAIIDYQILNAGGQNFNNNAFAHLRYNRKMGPVVRLELFSQIQFNSVTKIRARVLNGLGLRLKLADTKRTKMYLGVAAMYEHEELTEPAITNEDVRLSNYLSVSLTPLETLTVVNTTYMQPLADRLSDYRLSNNSKLVFDITKKLKFVTDFSFLYDTDPPLDIPKINYQVRNGITYRI